MAADLASGEGPLPYFLMAAFLICIHMAFPGYMSMERVLALFAASQKGTNDTMSVPPHETIKPSHVPKASSPNTFQHMHSVGTQAFSPYYSSVFLETSKPIRKY